MIKIQKIKLFLFIMLFFSSGIYAQSYYFKRAGAIGAGIKYNQLGFVATVYEKHQNNFHYRFLHGFVSDISTCEIVGAGLGLPVFSNKRKGVLKLNSTLSLNYSTFLTGKKYLISIPGKFGLQYNDKTNLLSFELGYGLNLYSLENKITAPRNLQLEQINHGIYFETSLNIYQIDFEAKDYNMASAANSFNISDVYFKLANKINHLKDKLKKKRRARKSLDIPILEFRNVKFSDGNNNKKIDSKETAYIYFILRNLGSGKTGEIVLKLKNKHGVDGLHYTKEKTFSSIRPNKSKNIKFKLIADETLPNDMAVFEIEAKYAKGKRNKVILKVPTHKVIGNTIQLGNLSDVDQNIPKTLKKNNNTYALIIGNEDYSPHQTNLSKENNAPYAANDAEIFYRYLNETLGVPEKNITLLKNATAGEMKQNLKKMEKLKNLVSDPAQIIFYYAGHGLPDQETKEKYLVPVDVNAENLEYGIKMKDVLQQLSSKENNRTLVFLDACFSGAARQKALPSTRGVRIKPKKNSIPANTLVFASSTGRETSGIHPGQNHGMFTYYLLKKLKDTRGKINLGALEEYLKQQVPLNSTLINNQTQNPTIQYDYNLKNEWKKWKLFK